MKFDLVEGNLILDALDGYDEYHLPRSVSRKTLYTLIKKFIGMLGIECDNGYSTPNMFHDKFDRTKSFELDLNDDEMDYINRAVQAGITRMDQKIILKISKRPQVASITKHLKL